MLVGAAPALAQFAAPGGMFPDLSEVDLTHSPNEPFSQEYGFRPVGNGSPQSSSGGGTRGTAQCDQNSFFIALLPEDGSLQVARPGHLQFPVLISAHAGQRVIQFNLTYTDGDQEQQYQYQQLISGAEDPELLEFELPTVAIPTAVNQLNWSFMMTCDGVAPDSPAIMERGWIDLTQISQVDQATLIEEWQRLLFAATAPTTIPALPLSTPLGLELRTPSP
ncbi:MAG: DUF928 domain-containing protein [Elainellaceae cyanobacterium]